MNAMDALYEKLDDAIEERNAEIDAQFKKLCERNTELAHQNLAFRIALKKAADKLEVMRNKQAAGEIRAVLALHPPVQI
jgi:hypothetical protein